MTKYWDKPGPENTLPTLEAAVERAEELGIRHLVVASNTGQTVEPLIGRGFEIICVTHHSGYARPGENEMDEETRVQLTQQGVKVLTTTHLLANVERAVTNRFGGLYPGGVISLTLRMFGQGTKVCLEIATMALDAGMIPYGKEIIAIGGTGRGADTALVLEPDHAKDFFQGQILEVICKPRRIRFRERG